MKRLIALAAMIAASLAAVAEDGVPFVEGQTSGERFIATASDTVFIPDDLEIDAGDLVVNGTVRIDNTGDGFLDDLTLTNDLTMTAGGDILFTGNLLGGGTYLIDSNTFIITSPGSTTASNLTGFVSVGFGNGMATGPSQCFLFGSGVAPSLTTGQQNVLGGYNAGYYLSAGWEHTAWGYSAMAGTSPGTGNTAIGAYTTSGPSSSYITGVGDRAMRYAGGSYSVGLGYQGGAVASGTTTANYSTFLGANTGTDGDATVNHRIALGYGVTVADDYRAVIADSNYITLIPGGLQADYASNTLIVDKTTHRVGIGTLSPAQLLDVNGNIATGGTTRIGSTGIGAFANGTSIGNTLMSNSDTWTNTSGSAQHAQLQLSTSVMDGDFTNTAASASLFRWGRDTTASQLDTYWFAGDGTNNPSMRHDHTGKDLYVYDDLFVTDDIDTNGNLTVGGSSAQRVVQMSAYQIKAASGDTATASTGSPGYVSLSANGSFYLGLNPIAGTKIASVSVRFDPTVNGDLVVALESAADGSSTGHSSSSTAILAATSWTTYTTTPASPVTVTSGSTYWVRVALTAGGAGNLQSVNVTYNEVEY